MNFLADTIKMDDVEMRSAYCDALIAEAGRNPKIMAVDADAQYSMGTKRFYEAFPGRSVNCGIMEAHAVGMSAGMSATGLIPFFHAFGTFATRRAFDQIFLSCAYQGLNVKIIGGDAGMTAMANGGTHMSFEDMALCRAIPGITIVEPADTAMYVDLVRHMAETYGLFYARSCRRKVMRIYRDGARFSIGKANELAEGKDVGIIACGIMVYEALKAREILADSGLSATVMDMHTIKPIDTEAVVRLAGKCGAIVTAENHNAIGALGSAVAETLAENFPVPMERVGVFESFGEVGTQDYLQNKLGLSAQDIVKKAIKCIRRKSC